MHARSLNILFTSVGRRVELLKAFRRAYETLGLVGQIVGVDIDPLAPALQVADRGYIVPRVSSADFIPVVVEICRCEHVDVIFPLIDPDIPVLAARKEDIETTGARLAVVSPEAAATTADKWLTAQFLRDLGVLTPRSWLPQQLDSVQVEHPVFIKPRRGSASQDTFKVRDDRELAFFSEYVTEPIIQEYLPGPEITNDVICDLNGDVLAVVSRQRIEVRWGEVAKGVTIYCPEITEGCVNIARALPAVGPITVQCIMKNGAPYFTEINARLGGGAPLAIEAGADFPRWLLARTAGMPVEIPPLGSYQVGLHVTRFDDSFFMNENEIEDMASAHF